MPENAAEKPKTHIHPAYSVTNIQTKIRTLDGKKVTYSSWVKLFKLHLKAYKVSHHIDGTPPPPATNPSHSEWTEIDALILQSIYSTVSDDILDRILENEDTAHEAWKKIEDVFLSNKNSRAAALLQEFTHTTLKDCASMDAYCQKLKDLARQLADVDKPIDESSLIIQLVNGLPKELDTIATILNTSSPTWNEARTTIDLEMRRLSARNTTPTDNQTNPNNSLLFTSHGQNKNTPNQTNNRSGKTYPGSNYRGNNYDPTFNFRMGRGGGNSRGRGGRFPQNNPRDNNNQHPPYQQNQTNNSQQTSHYPNPNYFTHPSTQHPRPQTTTWNTPPSPYPSAPTPHYTQPNQAHYTGPHTHNPPPTYDGLNPSDIGAALSNMQLTQRDPYWYMDTGASSHITSDSGPQGWTTSFPPQ